MSPRIYDAEHWRSHAEEALVVAEGMRDPEARRIMESVAASYLNLAEQAALQQGERHNAEREERVGRPEGIVTNTQAIVTIRSLRSTVRTYILRLTGMFFH